MHALLALMLGVAIGGIILFLAGTTYYVYEIITERYY